MKQVAQFEKVSLEQFRESVAKCRAYPANDINEEDSFISAMYESISLPVRATAGSAGYDFVSPCGCALAPGQSVVIPTGIRCRIDDGWVLMLYPRSGLGTKYRAQLDNTVGVIDSDYYAANNEGHIHIKMTNDSKTNKTLIINRGDKIVQGVFTVYGVTCDDHVVSVRTGGMGSTGR